MCIRDRVFLTGLPPVFKVNIREDQTGQWLENSIQYSIADASANHAGGEAVLAKLCETLFVETLRRYIVQLPERQTGWLAGARDPQVGKVLALMHNRPQILGQLLTSPPRLVSHGPCWQNAFVNISGNRQLHTSLVGGCNWERRC